MEVWEVLKALNGLDLVVKEINVGNIGHVFLSADVYDQVLIHCGQLTSQWDIRWHRVLNS